MMARAEILDKDYVGKSKWEVGFRVCQIQCFYISMKNAGSLNQTLVEIDQETQTLNLYLKIMEGKIAQMDSFCFVNSKQVYIPISIHIKKMLRRSTELKLNYKRK